MREGEPESRRMRDECDGVCSDFIRNEEHCAQWDENGGKERGKPSRAFDFGKISFEPKAHQPLAEVIFFLGKKVSDG